MIAKISQIIQNEISKYEIMLQKIEEFEESGPDGHLKIYRTKSGIYFGQQVFDPKTQRWKSIYINKRNLPLAKTLAQKSYYWKIKYLLQNNLKVLRQLQTIHHPKELEDGYSRLPKEIQMLVIPLHETTEMRIQNWNAEVYVSNPAMPEHLRYETEQGEFVRSKSEMIIANLLYQHRNTILYKYERPLQVITSGKPRTIYPDFTILNIHTGKITYLEHAGMMDDPKYANDYVRKVNTYMENNLLPGLDVLFTYESQMCPLELKILKKTIEILLEARGRGQIGQVDQAFLHVGPSPSIQQARGQRPGV